MNVSIAYKENSSVIHSTPYPVALSVTESIIQYNLDENKEILHNKTNSDQEKNDNTVYYIEPKSNTNVQQTPRSAFNMLRWKSRGDKHFQRAWSVESQSTQERKIKFGKKFQTQASQLYSLTAMIERQETIANKQRENDTRLANDVSILAACNLLVFQRQAFKDLWKDVLISLTWLFDFDTKQKKIWV